MSGDGLASGDEPVAEARRRPGRRPGSADTRGQILAAARETFAEKGFDKATIRGIARQAGVDPALVHHYFSGKEGMFVEAMDLPITPDLVLSAVTAVPREEAGERLVRLILTIVAEEGARQPVLALVRTAMTNEQMVATIREFMTRALLNRVAEALDVPPIRMEAAFRADVRRGAGALRPQAGAAGLGGHRGSGETAHAHDPGLSRRSPIASSRSTA
ncbi:TetR/AcrR family transcriptional regulator [Streptosporangium vulgare]|uniref:TetR/AcrR family transcriptional regulator n=1 Tax=Streptosporangium vulgare TaxID=46190 RepID=UPI003CD093F1